MQKLTVAEVHHFLAKLAPPSLAEEWDNVGLQVGSMRATVTGVLVALDVTQAAIDEALETRANLLITHHPLIFKPLRAIDDRNENSRLVKRALRHELHVLSFHTNLDSTHHGLNDMLGEKIGLKAMRPLLPARDSKIKNAGLGRLGNINPTSLGAFVQQVAARMNLKHLRFVGDKTWKVSRVAVMTGSGGGFFLEAERAGAQVLVTGDVKYHHALDALAEKIALIDIGHFAGEIRMVAGVAERLRRWPALKRSKLRVHEARSGEDPFQFWSAK